jgi:EPS-associated MarR family transcriptional regulator
LNIFWMDLNTMDEIYRIFKEIDKDSTITQREISVRLGYSLGKVNYIIGSLVEKGFVKLENFINNKNKQAYRYILTPKGIREKYRITVEFLKRKEQEFEQLEKEIEEMREDVKRGSDYRK